MWKKEQIYALNENSVFSLHLLTDVLKEKLISIKHAKNDINKSTFGNIDFLPYDACVIVEKALETNMPQMEKMGNFLYVIYIP